MAFIITSPAAEEEDGRISGLEGQLVGTAEAQDARLAGIQGVAVVLRTTGPTPINHAVPAAYLMFG